MNYDLIIKNGNIVFCNEVREGSIGIKDGKIACIATKIDDNIGEKVIDARGQYVMPGMIDTHFHGSDPGGLRSDWEGFITGSKALAAGGVTTFIDMPLNTLPATINKETFELKRDTAIDKNYVDYAFFGGLTPDNIDYLKELDDCGVVAYKCFMSSCGSDIEGDFKNVDDYDLYMGMEKLAELDQMLCIHAENATITDRMGEEAKKKGKKRPKDYVNSRPIFTEIEAVQRAILFAKETGCRVHFMHISAAESVELITKARNEGAKLSIESCPHYFVLSAEDFEEIGAKCKCSPPLRSKEEVEKMWRLLLEGKIDILSSDHSPCPFSMKDYENIFDAWGGIAGCQNSVDIMFDEAVKKRGMSINNFSKLISLNCAKLYNLKNKGELILGNDADIILLDPNDSYEVDENKVYYKNKITPYHGRKVNCRVTKSIVRGNLVFDINEGIISRPLGQLILRHK